MNNELLREILCYWIFDSSFFVKLDAFLNVVTIRPLKLHKKKKEFLTIMLGLCHYLDKYLQVLLD